MFKLGSGLPGGEKFWNSKRMTLVVVLVIGLFIGVVLQHYAVEPSIQKTFEKKFVDCDKENNVLNNETNQCILEKQACERSLKELVGS